ncbi:hypothetical protein BV22DRAFT_543521 [Leucogyrophana mollusca]|uniref:Uncharacterized protein n=1 Tax=Leucogyrophana mollusca TaxID=85980 RepID=A0ACB8BFE8_9AGAM|nr:hypothetical protein BV22DRAFT_543521 [Leucogyrophana mollusca]
MPHAESDDEFGDELDGLDFSAIPELSGIEGQTQNSARSASHRLPARRALPSDSESSGYGLDDDLDLSFLAAADAIEARATNLPVAADRPLPQNSQPTSDATEDARSTYSTSGAPRPSRFFSDSGAHKPPSKVIYHSREILPQPQKRSCTSPLHSPSAAKKGKMKEEPAHDLEVFFDDYENELTCPICCDIFVAAHLGNPCGHTCCGECGYEWLTQNKRSPTCPVCRTKLKKSLPLIPNFSVDNLVSQHIRALANSGKLEWKAGGVKLNDWNTRLRKWKDSSAKRLAQDAKAAGRKQQRRQAVPSINVVDLHHYVRENSSDADPTYEDDEDEVYGQGGDPPPVIRRPSRARTVRVYLGP